VEQSSISRSWQRLVAKSCGGSCPALTLGDVPLAIADAPPAVLRPFRGPQDTIQTMVDMCVGPRGERSILVHSLKNHIVRRLQPKDYLGEILAVRNFAAERIRYSNDALTVEQVQDPERISDQIIKYGRAVGDCFPANTRVLVNDEGTKRLVELNYVQSGDQIWGLNEWTTVLGIVRKEALLVDAIDLESREVLCLTHDHHVYVIDQGTEQRIRVSELSEGMQLSRPDVPPIATRQPRTRNGNRVCSIRRREFLLPCVDIETSDHRVYLPDHDVTVSQCDDIALWIATVCRQLGREAQYITVGFGAPGRYSHVFTRVKEPKSQQWIVCDPVAGSDEATMLRRVKTWRAWEIR